MIPWTWITWPVPNCRFKHLETKPELGLKLGNMILTWPKLNSSSSSSNSRWGPWEQGPGRMRPKHITHARISDHQCGRYYSIFFASLLPIAQTNIDLKTTKLEPNLIQRAHYCIISDWLSPFPTWITKSATSVNALYFIITLVLELCLLIFV